MPRQDKVFMIGWEYPPYNSGGLGVACEGMTQALALQNTQIYFTLPYRLGIQADHMQVLSCYDPEWESEDSPPFLAYKASLLRASEGLAANELAKLPESELEAKVMRYGDLVAKQAEEHQGEFDVIHAHDWMSFPAAIKAKKETGKPMISHVHSTEFDRSPLGGSQYIEETEYEGVQLSDRVITVSYYTKKLLVDKYGIDPARVDVVYNGLLDPSYYLHPENRNYAGKRPVIAFMGRLTMQKGAEFFIAVAKKVLQEIPAAIFVIAGSGDLYQELLMSTANNQLTASVLFSGFVRDTQKEKLLDRADIFIMPSVAEPFGLVALEAARHQIPVIVSKTSGVKEVMTSSIAIDFWDVDKMAETVLKLLKDKGYAKEVVKGQNKELKGVTWNRSAEQIKKIYQKTVNV